MLARLLAAAACVWLCACSAVQHEYRGPDAGALVYSTASVDAPETFFFWFKPAGTPTRRPIIIGHTTEGLIKHDPGFILNRPPDFKGRETGWVSVRYLKPGEYEVYQYTLFQYAGEDIITVWSDDTAIPVVIPRIDEISAPEDFSLRFTIEPGKATYLGGFTSLYPGGADAVLGILDRHPRDLALARKVDPALPAEVVVSVPDVAGLNIPRLEPDKGYWATRTDATPAN